MRTVPVREAKAKFSELLRAAEGGEEIVITRNGRPSVRLVPEGEGEGHRPPRKSFVRMLMDFPGGIDLERGSSPSRDIDL